MTPCAPDGDEAPAPALTAQAADAAGFLKALAHDGRLAILCHLAARPRSVIELENLLGLRQALVSQQLARLRTEGLVSARRDGQHVVYSVLDPRVTATLDLLARMFCNPA